MSGLSASNDRGRDFVSHPLVQRVRVIAWRARWLMLARALAISLAAIVCFIALLGVVDWNLRSQNACLRWSFSLLVLAGVFTVIRYGLFPAITFRFSLLDVATRIEKFIPSLGDRLTIAIAFLQTSDSKNEAVGELEWIAVGSATQDCEHIDLSSVIDPWPSVRAISMAAIVVAVLGLVIMQNPEDASYAAARMAQPWSPLQWPRVYHLRIDSLPEAIHSGTSLEFAIRDETRDLPADAVLFVKTVDKLQRYQPQQVGRAGVVRLDQVQETIEYRAAGGDDDTMDWRSIEVVDPPSVLQHKWILTPPAYSRLSVREIETQNFEVLAGTTGVLDVQLSKPILEASLRAEESEETSVGIVSADGLSARFEGISVDETTRLRLHLTDTNVISGIATQQWNIDVKKDLPPDVSWDQSEFAATLTTQAKLSLGWQAKDDLGLQRLGLTMSAGDVERELSSKTLSKSQRAASAEFELRIRYLELKPGDTFEIFGFAVDTSGQKGRSGTLSFTLVSPAEIRQQVAGAEESMLNEIWDISSTQRKARDQVLSAVSQLNEKSQSSEVLSDAADSQSEVARDLSGENGLRSSVAKALGMLTSNGLIDEDSHRLEGLLSTLSELADEHVAAISDELSRVAQSLPSDDLQAAKDSLIQVTHQQAEALDKLDSLASELMNQDIVRNLSRQLNDVLKDQERLQAETKELEGKNDAEQSAGKSGLVIRQRELSRRLTRIGDELKQASAVSEEIQPQTAARLSHAADAISDQAVANRMREAASELGNGRIGQASEKQDEIVKQLQAAEGVLEGRGQGHSEALAESLRQAGEKLEDLSQQQKMLTESLANDPSTNGDVAKRWRELAEQTERLKEQVQRLGAENAASSLEQAQRAQGQGVREFAEGNSEAAEAASKEAEQKFAEAQRELSNSEQEAEAGGQREQLWKLIEGLELIGAGQGSVVETLESMRNETKRNDELSAVATTEKLLSQSTRELAPELSERFGFRFAIESAAEDMERVVAELARNKVSRGTIDSAQSAVERIDRVIDVVMQLIRQRPSEQDSDSQEQQEQQGSSNEQRQAAMANIRLLLSLQQWLFDRTKAVEGMVSVDEADQLYKRQISIRLADEQEKLHVELMRIAESMSQQEEAAND